MHRALSTYGLCKVWTHCCWWGRAASIHASSSAAASPDDPRLDISQRCQDRHAPRRSWRSGATSPQLLDKVTGVSIMAPRKWLPRRPQPSYYMKAGARAYLWPWLYFPFLEGAAAAGPRRAYPHDCRLVPVPAVLVMLRESFGCAALAKKRERAQTGRARTSRESRKGPSGWTDNWVRAPND